MLNEDEGPDLANESADMTEGAVNAGTELRKRRSTRIVQAVPLMVTGVDALGRPFAERTSTLIINCHGCRYQSKHYVLKNMWVQLEVPHAEPGHPPRRVRGKVAWIQRPRTVRQLFQVALELEAPGNVWGIGFPPEDWFPFPEEGPYLANAVAPADLSGSPLPTTPVGAPLPIEEVEPGVATPDNIRVFPAPASTTDASMQLARQVARLLAEARQQINAAAQEAAAHAVNAERRVAFEQWEQKMAGFRDQVARETAQAVGAIHEESQTRTRAAQAAAAESLRNDLPRWLAPQLEQLTHQFTEQLAQAGTAQREQHEKQLSGAQEALQSLSNQANEAVAKLRSHAELAESQVSARLGMLVTNALEQVRQREEAAASQRDSLAAANVEAQNTLRAQLTQEVQTAQSRWQEQLQQSLNAAQQQATETLNLHAQNLLKQADDERSKQTETLRQSLEEQAKRLEETLTQAREVAENQSRLREQLQQDLNAAQESTVERLKLHSEDLRRQSEEEALRQSGSFRETLEAQTKRLEGTLAQVNAATEKQTQWHEQVEQGLNAAQEKATEKLKLQAQELRKQAEEENNRQVQAFRDSLESQERRLAETVAQAKEATDRLEQLPARVETVQQQAVSGFQSQLDDVLTLHRNELHRRSETLFEEIHSRIRSSFEAANSDALAKFDQQIQSMVSPHIQQTDEAIQRLAGGRSLLDAAMTMQQDRIRASADEAFAESLARFRENLGSIEQVLNDSSHTITSRHLEELEGRANDVKHQSFEELYKSAEWYGKKTQNQLQNLTEKLVEDSSKQLREKAGEVSGVFANELNSISRSFLGQTREQLDDAVDQSFKRVQLLFKEAADTTSAAFTDEIQRNGRHELEGFNELIDRSAAESRERLDFARIEFSQKLSAQQEDFLRRFQGEMNEAVGRGVADARGKVEAGFSVLWDSWKKTNDTNLNEMQNALGKLSNEGAEQYRARLENISNSWMVATVATLDHQSKEVIARIATAAEERLRETTSEVFARFGETLRERLQQIASGFEGTATPKQ